MAGEGQFLLFGLFFVLVVALGVFAYLRDKRRMEELRAVATRLGLRFEARGVRNMLGEVGRIAAMPQGRNIRPRNVMSGRYRGVEVRILDYIFTTGSGKHQQTHRHAIAIGILPVNWPDLTMVPENLGHKVFDALGGDDIDFESDEFSRRFWVRCSDRKFAYDVVNGRMMEFLMAPGWDRWQLKANLIVNWTMRGPLKPAEIQGRLDRIIGFVELIPSFRQPGVTITAAPGTPSVAA